YGEAPMKLCSAVGPPMRSVRRHPFALRYRGACSPENSSVFSVPLCPLCQTQPLSCARRCHAASAREVFLQHRGHRGTENTEKAIGQENGLGAPFDTSLRTGGVSAPGSKSTFNDHARFMRRVSRETRW